jgi:hypothetical protein|tara:strand:- start:1912 stop:2652 length:741 start_codon:yes stop_codon:yes gene_type:complete
MPATNIIIIIVVVLVVLVMIYFIQKTSFSQTSLTSGLLDATKKVTISSDKITAGSNGSANYTWSVWIFISDWSYRLGDPKVILSRGSTQVTSHPRLTLGQTENNLTIKQAIYTDGDTSGFPASSSLDGSNSTCVIPNIPIQQWVSIIVSLNGRNMDTYINGKLVKTCVLSNTGYMNATDDVNITPGGGFQGNVSSVKYWPTPISPQQAWNIYRSGPTGSSFSDLFTKYQIKFVFMTNGQEKGQFTI